MHVETSRSHQVRKDGTERTYERHLLRRSFRDGGKVRKETLANLSHLPPEAITAVRAVLAGKTLIDADAAFEVTRSLPHGHAAAVARDGPQARLPGPARPARPAARPGLRAGHLPGHPPRLQAVHGRLVGRRDPRPGPGRGGRVHR